MALERFGLSCLIMLKRLSRACDGEIFQAAAECRWMLEKIAKRQKIELPRTMHLWSPEQIQAFQETLPLSTQRILNRWISDRVERHKPLQYILKTQPFLRHEIKVRPPTLIPRWETEEWVARLIDELLPLSQLNILDLCTGTGCIAIALAASLDQARVVGLDISSSAVKLAQLNGRFIKSDLVFKQGDLMQDQCIEQLRECVDQGFDLIVSNPPYISPRDYQTLDPQVKLWEDPRALVTRDSHGIEFYQRIVKVGPRLLRPTTHKIPRFVFEIGHEQSSLVSSLWSGPSHVWPDLAGKDRVVYLY